MEKIILKDTEYPYKGFDHTRYIVRAFIKDGDKFIFTHIKRNDMFCNQDYMETSGGGIKNDENDITALKRELDEELGIEVKNIIPLLEIEDAYNLIKRKNINRYYLCELKKEGKPIHLDVGEENLLVGSYSLSIEEALNKYKEMLKMGKVAFLVAQREIPVLLKVKEILKI